MVTLPKLQPPSTPPSQPPARTFAIGLSGTRYELEVGPIGCIFNAVPGIYIIVRFRAAGTYDALYVGESENLWSRLTNQLRFHHCFSEINRAGATHIAALKFTGTSEDRIKIETDLRHGLKPPFNKQ